MTLNTRRRIFLKNSLLASIAGNAYIVGLLTPRVVLATWDEKAFGATNVSDVLKNGFGSPDAVISGDLLIDAPETAADGATVPVTVEAKLSDVESIAVISEMNPRPLCGIFHPGQGIRPKVSVRIKMGKTGDVIAVARSGGKLYMARRSVRVTKGGCE